MSNVTDNTLEIDDKYDENWIKYDLIDFPIQEYFVKEFIEDDDAIKILLMGDKNNITILFNEYTPFWSNSIEGMRMRTWSEVQIKYNDKNFFRKCIIYKIENSNLLKYIEKEGCGFYAKEDYNHFCIVSDVNFIDVICKGKPIIKIEENK